jgi:diguanylate cyclase (GGDEF)-like protein
MAQEHGVVDHTDAVTDLHEALCADLLGQRFGDSALGAAVARTTVGAVATLFAGAAALYRCEDDHLRLAAFEHPDPGARRLMDLLCVGVSEPLRPVHKDLLRQDLLQREVSHGSRAVHLTGEVLTTFVAGLSPPYQDYVTARGAAGLLVVPLHAGGRYLGALAVTRDGGGAAFEAADLPLLTRVARVVSLALAHVASLDGAAQAQRRAHALAHEDDVTGLLNRRGLLDVLRADPVPVGVDRYVAVFDIDGFGMVNDAFGHAAGDAVLDCVAARLCSAVSPATAVARVGGDEFAVLVEALSPHDAGERVRGIARVCSGPLQVLGLSVPMTLRAGLVRHEHDADRSLQHADLALGRAKRSGLDLALYDPELDNPVSQRLREVVALRRAIASGELVVEYQPVIAVGEGPLRVEALVRRRAGDVLIAPGEWLPTAHRAGLMPEVTESVVAQVVDQLARWWAGGLEVECAVNIPGPVLTPQVVATLMGRLDAMGLPRRALSVEITEGDLVGPSAREALFRCRDARIAVAVDDFGTGWSALSYLVDLPLSALKLDRTFVAGIGQDVRRAAVAGAVVSIAHELGLRVVAEGVETAEEADVVIDLGADAIQGFHYARPASAEAVTAILREGKVASHS